MAVTLQFLSAKDDGGLIKVSASSGVGSGTPIHVATSVEGEIDVVTLHACNKHSSDVVLSLEFGGETGDDVIEVTIPFDDGLHLILPGGILAGGNEINAFCTGTQNVIFIMGEVHRYS